MKKAKVISFVPRWPGPIEGHAVNTVKSFYPKLCAEHEFDDLMQEAYIVFLRCKQRYSGTVDNPSWFMSLFRNALRNKLINISALCKHNLSLEAVGSDDEPRTDGNEGYFACMFSELPVQVRRLVRDMCVGDAASSKAAAAALRRRYSVI